MLENLQGYVFLNAKNELTYAGLIRECWDEVAKENEWGEFVQSQYERNMVRRIIPRMPQTKGIKDLTIDDLRIAIDSLATEKDYASTTRASYWHLACLPIEWAAARGYCDNIFWGSTASLPSEGESGKARETLSRIPRSFSVKQNILLADHYLTAPELLSGEEFGEMLMFFNYFRNNEACGLDFVDIKPLQNYPYIYCLFIYSTTSGSSTGRKAGGKTRNAVRIIPLMTVVKRAILRRKKYVGEKIKDGEYLLAGDYLGKGIDDLPMVCRGNNYHQKCNSDDLSKAALNTFRELEGFNAKSLAAAEKDAEDGTEVVEESPTAYLYRRNGATMISNLGLTMAEIQYLMGHDIENTSLNRNDFNNEDILYEIWKKLEEHPINRLYVSEQESYALDREHNYLHTELSQAKISASGNCVEVKVSVVAAEPGCEPSISVTGGEIISEQRWTATIDVKETADILKSLQSAYQSAAEELGIKRPEWI